jgi:hypothetical protein
VGALAGGMSMQGVLYNTQHTNLNADTYRGQHQGQECKGCQHMHTIHNSVHVCSSAFGLCCAKPESFNPQGSDKDRWAGICQHTLCSHKCVHVVCSVLGRLKTQGSVKDRWMCVMAGLSLQSDHDKLWAGVLMITSCGVCECIHAC